MPTFQSKGQTELIFWHVLQETVSDILTDSVIKFIETNLNTIDHAQNSWDTCHSLKHLKGLISGGLISVEIKKI